MNTKFKLQPIQPGFSKLYCSIMDNNGFFFFFLRNLSNQWDPNVYTYIFNQLWEVK